MDENGVLAGLITETDIQKRAMFADASKDDHGHLRCGAAVGVGPDYLDRAKALVAAGLTPCSSTPPQAIPHA